MNKLKIYHQCGARTKWNLDSFTKDNVGDGVIFSPTDEKKEKIEQIENEVKEKSFFDPQYYWPRSDKKNLKTYEFFPNTMLDEQYSTANYQEKAYEDSYKCVEFQVENNFDRIIIPCVYKENFTEDYLEIQKEWYVVPFLDAISNFETDKPIFLTMIIKDSYLLDEKIRNDLLNFATSFQMIDGIYLIPEHAETYKRIRDERYLFELMKFIDILRQNDLLVHLGYTDIEGFILSLSDITSLSIGSYENTKSFNIEKFRITEGRRMGPNARVFSNNLLQNVEYTYLASLEASYPRFNELFPENDYKIVMFEPTYNWHFTKPEIYKYYFLEYSKILNELPENYEERYEYILEKLNQSMIYYKEIEDNGVLLDERSNGNHITHWINVINMFNRYKTSQ